MAPISDDTDPNASIFDRLVEVPGKGTMRLGDMTSGDVKAVEGGLRAEAARLRAEADQ